MNVTQPVITLLLVLVAGATVAHAEPPARGVETTKTTLKAGAGLRLSADELAYRQGALDLRGRVRIELGAMKLQAARLVVELDPQGRPRRLLAGGGVELFTGDATGRAAQAALQVGEGALQLSGSASVKLRGLSLELEGERIELDLGSGAVRVRHARARLELPAASGGTHAHR